MAESCEVICCDSCEHRHISTPATKWCTECDEGYCQKCVQGHDTSKKLRSHHIISISDYLKIKDLTKTQVCEQHNKDIDFFCPDHDTLLCVSCIPTAHASCKRVLDINEAANGVKKSTALSDVEGTLTEIISNIENVLHLKDNIDKQVMLVSQEIQKMRNSIIKHFDELEQKILKDIRSKQLKLSSEVTRCSKGLEQKRQELQEMIKGMSLIRDLASDRQTFISTYVTNEKLLEEKKNVSSILSEIPAYDFRFVPSDEISKFPNICSFGEIRIERSRKQITYKDAKSDQGQIPVPSVNDIESVRLTLKKEISVKGNSIRCCLLLPNKHLLFGDYESKRLLIYNESGTFDHEIEVSNNVYSACIIDDERVAVTCGLNGIDIVDLKKRKVVQTFQMSSSFHGIFYHNNKLYISSLSSGILVTDLNGTVDGKVPFDCYAYSLCAADGRLYYCHGVNHEICCQDVTGPLVWKKQEKRVGYDSPTAVGRHGFVFVSHIDGHVLNIVSSDGVHSKDILDRSNKLNRPRSLYCDKGRNLLLICNEFDGCAALYDVRY